MVSKIFKKILLPISISFTFVILSVSIILLLLFIFKNREYFKSEKKSNEKKIYKSNRSKCFSCEKEINLPHPNSCFDCEKNGKITKFNTPGRVLTR